MKTKKILLILLFILLLFIILLCGFFCLIIVILLRNSNKKSSHKPSHKSSHKHQHKSSYNSSHSSSHKKDDHYKSCYQYLSLPAKKIEPIIPFCAGPRKPFFSKTQKRKQKKQILKPPTYEEATKGESDKDVDI